MADTPAELDEWIVELATALGIDASTVPTSRLLDLTRDVAHGVTRPAGPVSTYLVGMAVARGAALDDAVRTTLELVERRAS
ncbi:DUF6457 domain-containing protein [Paramicrobacterium chengjingii]|uniref:PH domain-containing protein n=1 Tax=Paramicrobacterium chengjingii TaxID=2769067 RepID=A0ABX6YFF1_9MICO|nr:DUF6457 domain-containing protein [Microbacterium chengjingii]QPZ37528.1 hypothetical protein HCR76_11870 [Microbacterium chengjingii]